jgi:hypothetical protein
VTKATSACDTNHSKALSQIGIMSQVRPAKPNILHVAAKEPKLVFVSRTRVTIAVSAVVFWAVTPVLACLLPCLATASAKQECSYHIAMHCGRSMITAGRICCQVSSRPEMATVGTQISQSQKRVLAVVAVVAHVSPSEVTPRPASLAFFESPPHEAPPLSSFVLRI